MKKSISDYIKETNRTEEEVIDILKAIDENPARDFYHTVVVASKIINELIRDKELDLDVPFQKSMLRILEVGDKISKTITSAKMEAYPKDDDDPGDAGGFADRIATKKRA